MSRKRKATMSSQMANDISCRLGAFMDLVNPGPHKDKHIAQRLDISVAMAKVLRSGRGWTAARIGQVWSIYGRDFVNYVFDGRPMSAIDADLETIKSDLAILKARLGTDAHETFGGANANRSEERRVGKECRSRWSPYH